MRRSAILAALIIAVITPAVAAPDCGSGPGQLGVPGA